MSYANLPRTIVAGTGITVTPTTGTGSNLVTISANGLATLPTRIATTSPITVTTADGIVVSDLTVPAPVAVTLPAVPNVGQLFYIKDGAGNAATFNITVTPLVGLIDGAATATINTDFGSLTVAWDGSAWVIL